MPNTGLLNQIPDLASTDFGSAFLGAAKVDPNDATDLLEYKVTQSILRNLVGVAKRTWTPSVSGTGIISSGVLASEIEIDGLHQFAIEAVLDKSGEWTLIAPEFSLPSGVGTPTMVRGNVVGYGGSETKFFETLFATGVVTEGNIAGATLIAAAVVHNNEVYVGRSSGLIYKLNPTTRVATQFVDTGGHNWNSLASHGGTLYGWSNIASDQRLYSITSSGATAIGNDQNVSLIGLASANGTLYGISGIGVFYSINTSNSVLAQIGTISNTNIQSLFTVDNKVYAIDRITPYEIYRINLSNGSGTQVGTFNAVNIYSSFVYNDKLYGITSANPSVLYSLELNVPPLTSVDFSGPTYTTALGQCRLRNGKIAMDIEKLQKNDDEIFIQATGQYAA